MLQNDFLVASSTFLRSRLACIIFALRDVIFKSLSLLWRSVGFSCPFFVFSSFRQGFFSPLAIRGVVVYFLLGMKFDRPRRPPLGLINYLRSRLLFPSGGLVISIVRRYLFSILLARLNPFRYLVIRGVCLTLTSLLICLSSQTNSLRFEAPNKCNRMS